MFNFCKNIAPMSLYPLYTLCITLLFQNYRNFDHHLKLPQLSTHLYWSHSHATSIFSVSFEATPPSLSAFTPSNSTWVAWGINPTGSALIGTKLIFLSLDSHREAVNMKMYNVSSETIMDEIEILGNFVTFGSSFDSGLIKFKANIFLPEKRSETINHLVMVGFGKHNVHDTNHIKSFGILNLLETKQSIFTKTVDAISRALTFEKGCTLGSKKWRWDKYITSNNQYVMYNYVLLTIGICFVYLKKENSRRVGLARLLCIQLVAMPFLFMTFVLEIKENGYICLYLLGFVGFAIYSLAIAQVVIDFRKTKESDVKNWSFVQYFMECFSFPEEQETKEKLAEESHHD